MGNFLGDLLDILDPLIEPVYDFGKHVLNEIINEFVDIPNPEDHLTKGILVNKQGNTHYIPVVYGEQRIDGIIAFMTVTGAKNEYLHIVYVLCEGEIEAIDNVYLDDVLTTDTRFTGFVRVNSYTGTTSQAADADLVSEVTNWTTAHKLSGVAYVYIRLQWDNDAFTRLPVISCDVRGRKVKDIRTSPNTTAYSNNPALCIRDYLTDTIYGKGLPESVIDDVSFSAAATTCETQIESYSGGANINLYACDGTLDTSKNIFNNIKALLSSCSGWLPSVAGKYTLVINKTETPTFTFDENNIVGGWTFGKKGKRDIYNRVIARYRNPNRSWQPDVVVNDNPTLRINDNNTLLEKEFTLPFDISPYRATYKTEIALKQSRQSISTSFAATTEAWQVSVGEVVYITHATPGWTSKEFRVMSLNLRADGFVQVSFQEYEATVYDRTVPAEQISAADTGLPNPYSVSPPTGLTLTSGTNVLYIRDDGTIISRIKCVWVPAVDIYVKEYSLEYKKSADSIWVMAARPRGVNTSESYISDVEDGVAYDVRINSINSNDIGSIYNSILSYVVIGKTEPPNDCDSFLVQRQADGTREFTGGLLNVNVPLDFAGYKIRAAQGTGLTWEQLYPLYNGLIQALPWETNQLAAGTYTAGIKAVDTTGNESTNAILIQSTLGDPRINNILQQIDPRAEGWLGTLTSCWISDDGNLYATDQKDWDSFIADSPITTWAGWTSWARSPNSSFTYDYKTTLADYIDVGGVVSFTPLVSANGNGTVVIQESHSDGDTSPWSWSAYADTGVLITTRYIKLKVTVTNAVSLASLTQMDIILSAELIEEFLPDLDTSTVSRSPTIAGDLRIPVTKTYAIISQVNIALQNVGAGWSWEIIDKAITGPRIKIYNASAVLADATIDVEIKGL